jgi:hypothetical protein
MGDRGQEAGRHLSGVSPFYFKNVKTQKALSARQGICPGAQRFWDMGYNNLKHVLSEQRIAAIRQVKSLAM